MTDARALIASIRTNYSQWYEVQRLAELAEALIDERDAEDIVSELLLSGVFDYDMGLQLRVEETSARVRALLEPQP